MAVKIRLARRGRKARPFYHIIIADSKAPRDGKYIEKIGSYNPTTNPATVVLDFDKALHWVQIGAQPTDTCRQILSHRGVMLKHHLLNGVKKGALTEEDAETKFNNWLEEKESKINSQKEKLDIDAKAKERKAFEKEQKINQERAAKLAKAKAALLDADKKEEQSDENTEEQPEENPES